MAWYRKYRPQRVADLQIAPVREQLLKVLESGKISHAYLFAGPKGTGKTSTARILARVLNDPANEKVVLGGKGKLQEPDDKNPLLQKIAEGQSQVVIELDAASHRGIDDVRRLQEMIAVVPTEGLVRVVILDEVHMLTNEAFNALLKVLEEPPERVVFVLATTELHKVPATIQSRCELIQFRQATIEEVIETLQRVAKGEKVELSEDQAQRLAQAARGSFRDAVKYLEQVARGGEVDEALLEQVAFGQEKLEVLLRALAARNAVDVSAFFQEVRQKGENFSALEQAIVSSLQERLHRAIARSEKPQTIRTLVSLLDHLAQRLGGPEPVDGIKLEVACLLWCIHEDHPAQAASGGTIPGSTHQAKVDRGRSQDDPTRQGNVAAACAMDVPATSTPLEEAKQQAKEEQKLAANAPQLLFEQVQANWSKVLLTARAKSQALEAILRQAKVRSVVGSRIELEFSLTFHKDQLDQPKYQLAFLSTLSEVFGEGATFSSLVIAPAVEAPVVTSSSDDLLLKAVEEAVLSLG